MDAETVEEIIEIIASCLRVEREKVTENAHFIDHLGADSLDMIDLYSVIEERFCVNLSINNAEIVTLQEMKDFVENSNRIRL